MAKSKDIVLSTALDELRFDATSGRLISLAPLDDPQAQLIASAGDHPVFAIQYLDEARQYQQIDSHSARRVRVSASETGDVATLVLEYSDVGGLDVTATVRAFSNEPQSRWSISIDNSAGTEIEIVSVQFPFIVTPYGPAGQGRLLYPFNTGVLLPDPAPNTLATDNSQLWQFQPSHGDTAHYPGSVFAQFLAYYHDRAGLYLACEDTEAHVKLFKPLHHEPGLRLGVAHVGDWPRAGRRWLEYDIVLGSFRGDWHAAAEIYRNWSQQQKWATPLYRRNDVPQWLLDSPPHITLRLQGVLDEGPAAPVEEFLPYEKAIPLLEKVAEAVDAPLVPVIMSWERGGPWVYPDCFPPIGGDESVTKFATLARQRGWHAGSFCNGSRWVTGHYQAGYDGSAYFKKHHGERSVCRLPDGEMWQEHWDKSWRPSYACCLGASPTRRIAADFVRRLIGWGLESIQFFDQNVNAATFPCFATDHDHPPVPGKWMAQRMEQTIQSFQHIARKAGETGVIQSVEQPCNEYCLPLFQQCDVRTAPGGQDNFVPVYHYLYHECIIMHGMMSTAPEPYHLPIKNAFNGVLGEIPGGVMIGDGTLLNRETYNWAPWEPRVGSNDDALSMLRAVTAIRRGPGKPFLVFGRMQPPAAITGIKTIKWTWDEREHQLPAVFHAAWQAPDGRFAVALANWTTSEQRISLQDERLGSTAVVHTAAPELQSQRDKLRSGGLRLALPPLSFVLAEVAEE